MEDAQEVTVGGVTYRVDGKKVQLSYSPHEKEIAELLEREVGGEMKMLPKVNVPQNVRTPDYLFHGKAYDLKTLTGKSRDTLFRRVRASEGQANSFIVDVTKTGMTLEAIKIQAEKIYWSKDTDFVDELIVIKNGHIIFITKRQ